MSENQKVLEEIQKVKEHLDTRFEKVDERLDSIEKVQIQQHANLEHHIYRTDLAEENIKLLQSQIENNTQILAADLKEHKKEMLPVKKHVDYMNGALKGLGITGIIAGISKALIDVFHILG